MALVETKIEIGHGKLLEPVDVSRQDMDQIEDILSLLVQWKQEDIKEMTCGLQWADREAYRIIILFFLLD